MAGCAVTGGTGPAGGGKADELADRPADCPRYAEAIVTGQVHDSNAREISGLVMSRRNPGLLWAHNDGDSDTLTLYALDRNGEMRHQLRIPDLDLVDLEDIAIGPGPDPDRDYLYLADTGDNPDNRDEVSIIRFPEPDLLAEQEIIRSEVEVFRFRYDDHDPHDAEALFVDPESGEMYVITKNGPLESRTRVYRSDPPGDLSLSKKNELHEILRDDDAPDLEGSVVAADISADGRRLALLYRDEDTRTWLLEDGETIIDALRRPACLSPAAPGQQEALAYSVDSEGYYMVPEGDEPKVFFVADRNSCPEFEAAEDLGAVVADALVDVSGLVLSSRNEEVLWAVSDAGNGTQRNVLTALHTNGSHIADIELPGIENQDWEDLAIGPGPVPGESYLYIADIGDKDIARGKIEVHRFIEPALDQSVQHIDTFSFEYPGDKPHDAQSLFIDPISGDLFIITRQRSGDDKTRAYRARAPFDASTKTTLDKVLDAGDNQDLADIVSADISPDGLTLALARRNGSPLLYQRQTEGPAFEALKYRGCRSSVASGKQDSIALRPDGKSFYQLGGGDPPHLFQVSTRP